MYVYNDIRICNLSIMRVWQFIDYPRSQPPTQLQATESGEGPGNEATLAGRGLAGNEATLAGRGLAGNEATLLALPLR